MYYECVYVWRGSGIRSAIIAPEPVIYSERKNFLVATECGSSLLLKTRWFHTFDIPLATSSIGISDCQCQAPDFVWPNADIGAVGTFRHPFWRSRKLHISVRSNTNQLHGWPCRLGARILTMHINYTISIRHNIIAKIPQRTPQHYPKTARVRYLLCTYFSETYSVVLLEGNFRCGGSVVQGRHERWQHPHVLHHIVGWQYSLCGISALCCNNSTVAVEAFSNGGHAFNFYVGFVIRGGCFM